jgi:hypothetical protein
MTHAASLSRAVVASLGAAVAAVACSSGSAAPERAQTAHRVVVEDAQRGQEPEPVHETILCDRLVDDFGAAPEGAFPPGWETYPASSLEVAQRQGLYRVVTIDERRALQVRASRREILLGRGVENWDLEKYPFVEWLWRPAPDLDSTHASSEPGRHGAASVTAVWMIGLPFMVRRLSYALGSSEPEGTLRSERFGYDKWLAIDSQRSPARSTSEASWHRVRVNVLSNYRKVFDRADSESPTGLSLTAPYESQAGAYFADIRLCRRAPVSLPSQEPQETVP